MQHQRILRIKLFLIALFTISLFFSITNYIPLSLTFAVGIVLMPLLLLMQKSMPPLLGITVLLIGYFLLWTLVYDPAAFTEYRFYRRDGNVFATFLPLLFFGMLCLEVNIEKIAIRFLLFVTIINSLMFVLLPRTNLDARYSTFSFLFQTHNAAGGFLSVIVALSIAVWFTRRSFWSFVVLFLNSFMLWETHSRGSIIALFGALVVYLFLKERHVKKIVWFSIIATLVLLTITYPMWLEMGQSSSFIIDSGGIEDVVQLEFERSYTFLDRALFLWPRALHLFFQSPLIGTGFGSYNDLPYRFHGIPYLFSVNIPERYQYSDEHAHHSFLHILAETGLLGLALTILMLCSMHRFIQGLQSKILKDGLMLMFWIAVWSSMTEHRLFTPSQMLPFTLLLGIALGNARAHEKWSAVQILEPIEKKWFFALPKNGIKRQFRRSLGGSQ